MSFLKRSPVFVILLAVLAGYFGYRWFGSRPPEVWKYIPDSATVIISSNKLQESFSPGNDSIPSRYSDLPFISQAKGTLSVVRWFNEDQEQINTFLKDKTVTYAFHPLAGGRPGIVMYLPIKNDLEKKWLDNPKRGSLRVSSHNFQGHPVYDISNERSEALFSYILKNDFLIISQHGELIEDVIRNASSGKTERSKLSGGFEPVSDGTHDISIYTNGKNWLEFVFPSELDPNVSAFLDFIPDQYGFHLKPDYTAENLNFRSDESKATDNRYRSLLADLEGTPFDARSYISQRATHLIRISAKNESRFRSAYKKWLENRRSLPAIAQMNRLTSAQKDAFLEEIGSEIILCVNGNSGGNNENKVMLIKYGDFNKARDFFESLANTTKEGSITTHYHGYHVFPISIPSLMENMFGPLFKGFDASYLTFLEPYLVVGNTPQALQDYLIDHENQFTWDYSPELDSLNFYYRNTAPLLLATNMNKVRAATNTKRTSLKSSLDQITSTILSYGNKGKYAEINLEINYSADVKTASKTGLLTEIQWNHEFPSSFSAITDPAHSRSVILLTNKNYELIEFGSSSPDVGKVLTQLDGPMHGRAYRTDFLNIGRPQHIVNTTESLYVIDEDDNGLVTVLTDPAPRPIQSMYRMNNSRESSAQFVLKSDNQDLYVWKKAHQPPVKLNTGVILESVLNPVVSFSDGNKTFYIVTQRNGEILMFNENGKIVSGFPVDMLSSIGGSFATRQNSNNGAMEVSGVNLQGEYVKIGLNGDLIERKQLVLPESGCSFRTLFDENLQDWVFIRHTHSRAAILDKDGNEIFEIIGLRRNFNIRYHYFGSDNRFISVVSDGFVSVFDFHGNRIGDTPIPCEGSLGLTYQGAEKELNMFSQVNGKIQVWSVKFQ